jgi:hypothetical protein
MSQPCGCCAGIQIITPESEASPPGMSAINYRVGTYATFYETMLARLSTLYLNIPSPDGSGATQKVYPLTQLTTREPSDPAIALLDAWAVVADVLTFYQERIANEGYLPTATERRSLLELARLVNYTLRPGVSASVYLAFTVQSGFSGTIPAGSRAQSMPGSGQMPQFYETSADLDASDAWNNLQPRLTRPQVIASNGAAGIDPATLHTLYFQGLTTNLKIGDGIIIAAGDAPVLRLVDSVNPQATDQRTQVVLRELPNSSPPTLNEVAERYITEAASVFQGSDIAAQVSSQLTGLIQQSTPTAAAVQGVFQNAQQSQAIAVARNFTRLDAWISDLLNDLQAAIALSGPGVQPPSSALGKLDAIIGALALPPHVQPASSISLARTVSQVFAPQSDTAPRLLAAFHPAAAATLYPAWANIATAPSTLNVYAARTKAGIFANNFAGAVSVTEPEKRDPNKGGNTTTTTTIFTPPLLGDAVRDLISSDGLSLIGLPLDATYDQIKPGSWVVIDRPTLDPNGNPNGRTTTAHLVQGVQTVSRETATAPVAPATLPVPTGYTAKVTQLSLNSQWLTNASDFQQALVSPLVLRGTVIYAQAEELSLAEEPLDHDVEGNTVELDGLYDGLESGRWVFVSGERTDIPNTTGVTASELVMIAGVSQGTSKPSCMAFATTTIPFTEVFYITPPNAAGDRLVVGTPIQDIVEFLNNDVPQPNQSGHQPICGPFQLAAGLYADAYLPTADERAGNFSDFADVLSELEPPIKGGLFDAKDPRNWAWRISGITQGNDTVHTNLVLANGLAYTYASSTVTISGNVVAATNGQTVGEVLGNGNASQAFQTFALHQSPLTYLSAATPSGAQSTLTVTVNEIEWQETDDISALGPNDHGYTTQTDNSAQTTVITGNGETGARVPTGTANVKAVYRYGIGSAGNVDAQQISQLATQPGGVQSVINPLPATGGADPDTASQARVNTPLAVKALDRLVSVQDYADFSRTYAGIGKAASVKLSNGRRQVVFITIAGAEDIPILPTSGLYQNLVQALQQFGDPHLPILIGVRKAKLLVIGAGIQVLPGYQFDDVEPNVRAALLDTFGFDQRNLGQTAFLSEAISAMQGVQGVAFVNVTIFDSVAQDATVTALASLSSSLVRREHVSAKPARVDTSAGLPANPTTQDYFQIKPAEIAYLTPDIPDTLILTEITATNPGPPLKLRHQKAKARWIRRAGAKI